MRAWPIRSKRELFDVGVAGPLAGFAALLPFLIYGVWQSVPVSDSGRRTDDHPDGALPAGQDRCCSVWSRWLAHGPAGPDTVLDLHPFALAAWVGILVTALNLLPFGQLDGGHILYAVHRPAAAQAGPAVVGAADPRGLPFLDLAGSSGRSWSS